MVWNEMHHTGVHIGKGKAIKASSGKGRVIIRDLWGGPSAPVFMFQGVSTDTRPVTICA